MYCSNCGCFFLVTYNFCDDCGKNLEEEKSRQNESREESSRQSAETEDGYHESVDSTITDLFHCDYPYIDIVRPLERQIGVVMHVQTLKRRLQHLGLSRRSNIDENTVMLYRKKLKVLVG